MQQELTFREGLRAKFEEYHKKHPEVYEKFVGLARTAKYQKGFKRHSARDLFRVMRWLMAGEIKQDGFKINNSYTPYYARKMESEYPEFKDFFTKRTLKSA